jgi:dihydrofolate reductase
VAADTADTADAANTADAADSAGSADAADTNDQVRREIGLIWAEAKNHVIGHNGVMPWHLPEDLAHFKTTTLGSAVVMGRRTWDSLPERFRPLAGRTNIVITRQEDWAAAGATVVHTLDEALVVAAAAGPTVASIDEGPRSLWIIGGGQVYAEALPLATRVVVTELDLDTEGDTVAPELSGEWTSSRQPEQGWLTSRTGIRYSFVDYRR